MIVGERVTLRPLQPEDVEQTLLLRYDMEANKALMGFPHPVNIENEKQWLTGLYPNGERKAVFLALIENSTHDFAGYMSVKNINYISGTADFGIILGKNFRGKGYASEGMKLFFNYLYRELHLRKLTLYVLEDNTPAVKAYERIGFVREGLLKEHTWQSGLYKNVVIMSIFEEKLEKLT
jgi:RimJ/RimL family protein N-acetyltransferase